jgi:trimethylamine--corrinoid protein Co-methyltransferase
MSELSPSKRPLLQLLSKEDIEHIHDASLTILEKTGVIIKNTQALTLLKDFGCDVDFDKKTALIPQRLMKECIGKAPSAIRLHGRDGKHELIVGESHTIFNPGSTALYFIDHQTGEIRKPVSKDLVDLVKLADTLKYIHAQSTALVPSDVPEEISDLYRLYLVLKNSPKAIITGAFTKQGLIDMKRLLVTVAGGEDKLRIKPMAVFDVCPSSPLMWSDISCQNLIDCARSNMPAEIIPAPQMGATSPITLAGTLVQFNAEFLSGLVMSQAANPKAPVIYGGSPTTFDMRYCTSRLGAIENIMVACASSHIGKFYRLPTHAYLGLSDSKMIDAQSGLESSLGIVLGVLAGINNISGPGMLVFESCQSLEKLVIDNEICGMSLKLVDGIAANEESLALGVISKVGPGGHYLAERHTRELLHREHLMPSNVIDRLTLEVWKKQGSKDMTARARETVSKTLSELVPEPLPPDVEKDLRKVLTEIMNRYNIKSVPIL